MEKGLKNLDELDRQIAIKNTQKDTSKIKSNSNSSTSTNTNSSSSTYGKTALGVSTSTVFPHFAIAAEICPSYLRSNWSALHKEDDVLVSRQCTPPQVSSYSFSLHYFCKFEFSILFFICMILFFSLSSSW